MTQIDFPFVRSSLICPLCRGGKDVGTLCCWSCAARFDLRAALLFLRLVRRV